MKKIEDNDLKSNGWIYRLVDGGYQVKGFFGYWIVKTCSYPDGGNDIHKFACFSMSDPEMVGTFEIVIPDGKSVSGMLVVEEVDIEGEWIHRETDQKVEVIESTEGRMMIRYKDNNKHCIAYSPDFMNEYMKVEGVGKCIGCGKTNNYVVGNFECWGCKNGY